MSKEPKNGTIADEFRNTPINDQRLVNRLILTATALNEQPEKSIPDACQTWAATKGAYQLFSNNKVTPEVILEGHRANAIERMKKYNLVLLIQDTTSFDFTSHHDTQGLGPYATIPQAQGLLMHSVLAVTPNGVPLGLLYQNTWARPLTKKAKSNEENRRLSITDKESFKWLKALEAAHGISRQTKTVWVSDRESDIFEYFQKAHQQEYILIRAVRNRRILEEHQRLRAQIDNSPIAGVFKIDIPRKPEKKIPERQAVLSIQFCQVTICPAHTQSKNPESALPMYVILAKEIEAPDGEEAVEWLLLTNIPVTNMQEALQKVEWYRQRWKIERFHFTLKSGCHVEQLQLETSNRLKNAIALYSVIAWRLLWLMYQSRATPDIPCSIILEPKEWQALYCVVNRTKEPPVKPPTLYEAIHLLARLGGFLNRKNDGEPGVKVLWRGLQRLNEGLLFVEYFNNFRSSL